MTQILKQGTTSNEVFAIKTHWRQLQHLMRMARKYLGLTNETDLEVISILFSCSNPKFVYIKRRDLLKQAISWEIAKQTGIFHRMDSSVLEDADPGVFSKSIELQNSSTQKLVFKPLKIFQRKEDIKSQNKHWENFFISNSINYYEVIYENFIIDIPNIIIDLINFIEIEHSISENTVQVPLKKLSNSAKDEWYKYYNYIPEILLKIARKINCILNKN